MDFVNGLAAPSDRSLMIFREAEVEEAVLRFTEEEELSVLAHGALEIEMALGHVQAITRATHTATPPPLAIDSGAPERLHSPHRLSDDAD